MKLKCLHVLIVPGLGVLSKGDVFEWHGAIPSHFYRNVANLDAQPPIGSDGKRPPLVPLSRPENGSLSTSSNGELFPSESTEPKKDTAQEEADKLVERTAKLGKNKIMPLLDKCGASYNPDMTAHELALIYQRHIGQA